MPGCSSKECIFYPSGSRSIWGEGMLILSRNQHPTVGFGNIAGEIRVPSYMASGNCHPWMLIICKLRNNTLRNFVGMKGDVMTTGNRRGTYYGVQKRRVGEEELVNGFPALSREEISSWPVNAVPAWSVGTHGLTRRSGTVHLFRFWQF